MVSLFNGQALNTSNKGQKTSPNEGLGTNEVSPTNS